MKSLTKDESPLQLLVDFSDFLSKYNNYLGTTWLPKLKRAFARYVTYPLLRNKISKCLKKNAQVCIEQPDYFLEVITNFVASLISRAHLNQDTLSGICDKTYVSNYHPIKILFNLSPGTNNLSSYKIIVRNLSSIDTLYKGTMISIELRVDIERGQCELEIKQYETKEYVDDLSKLQPDVVKNLLISANGKLVNPNYIYSQELVEDDYVIYSAAILMIFQPIFQVFDGLCTARFINLYRPNDLLKG